MTGPPGPPPVRGRISHAEDAELARLMAKATGDNRLPLRIIKTAAGTKAVKLFPCRTGAKRWGVLAELT